MRKFTTRDITLAALIAAVYAVLTLGLPLPPYAGIQLRVAEAMTVLPFLFPAATPGLVVGCFIVNLFSPFPLDLVFGTLATLLACLLTQLMPSRWLAPLPPVIANAVIVGFELCCFSEAGVFSWGNASLAGFLAGAISVGIGELVVCYALGVPLMIAIEKTGLNRLMASAG